MCNEPQYFFTGSAAWLYLWLPVSIALAPYGVWLIDPTTYIWFVRSEFGVIENLTVLFLLLTMSVSVKTYRQVPAYLPQSVRLVIVLWVLGCLYFEGEELSWGQHFIGWQTPDSWQGVNTQHETNAHNIRGIVGKIAGQLPRNALTLFAIGGGIIAPIVFRIANIRFDPKGCQYWLWPTATCLPAAFLGVNSTAPRKIVKLFDLALPVELMTRLGEVKECLLALFLLLYMLSLLSRVRATVSPGTCSALREKNACQNSTQRDL